MIFSLVLTLDEPPEAQQPEAKAMLHDSWKDETNPDARSADLATDQIVQGFFYGVVDSAIDCFRGKAGSISICLRSLQKLSATLVLTVLSVMVPVEKPPINCGPVETR